MIISRPDSARGKRLEEGAVSLACAANSAQCDAFRTAAAARCVAAGSATRGSGDFSPNRESRLSNGPMRTDFRKCFLGYS